MCVEIEVRISIETREATVKRTNQQVINAAQRMVNKHGYETEELYTALVKYWVRYDLDEDQCEILNRAKRS